jgi:ketosteroid isomerase-like protein
VTTRTDTDVVLANNAAFVRRDLEGMLALFAPDAVCIDMRPGGFGEYHGTEEIRAYYGGIFDNTESIREDLEIVSSADGMVVSSCRMVAVLSSDMGSGEFPLSYALLADVRDGLIARLEVHPDVDAALASRR